MSDYDSYNESSEPAILKQVMAVHLATVGGVSMWRGKHSSMSVVAALKALGRHMCPGIQPENVELLYNDWDAGQHNRIWVEFDPADWSSVVKQIMPFIGIREVIGKGPQERTTLARPAPSNHPKYETDDGETFSIGPVRLTHGSKENRRTTWTSVIGSGDERVPVIDRPNSYREAVDYIQAVQASQPNVFCPGGLDLSHKILKFHTFMSKDDNEETTTHIWVDIPDNVRTDEVAWRRYVPEPYQILGFTLQTDIQIQTADNSTQGK